MFREIGNSDIVLGFLAITAAVLIRMSASREGREKLGVKLFGCSNTFLRNRRRT